MAHIDLKLQSDLLQTCVNINMYFPCDLPAEPGFVPKGTLTLLHGYHGSSIDWVTMTAAARYAADNSLVLICPSCQNYFYQDSALGHYKTFLTQEMPDLLSRIFIFPKERERNFIAGLSMGGYGALYLGMSHPEIYGGCASFSGALDMNVFINTATEDMKDQFSLVLGAVDGKMPEYSDLLNLTGKIAALPKEKQPKILTTCGYEDIEKYFIKHQNDSFYENTKKYSLANYKHMQWTGDHTWNFWDRSLVYAIDFFLDNGYANIKHEDWSHVPNLG